MIVVLLVLLAVPATAKKTDVVITARGIRFVGEIKKLEYGLLELSMDDLKDNPRIKWVHVVRVTSAKQLDMELRDGRRLFGSLVESSADGKMRIRTLDGEFEVDRSAVVFLEPIKTSFAQRFKADVSTGFSYIKSTEFMQFNVGGSVQYRSYKARTDLGLNTVITSTEGEAKSNSSIPLTHYRYFQNKWFYRGDAAASHNDELGIDFRGQLGGGIGRRLIQSNLAMFQVSLMLSGNREFTSDDRKTNNLEAVFDTNLKVFRYDSPKVDFDLGLTAYANLTSWGRYRLDIDARFSIELIKDLFWDLGQVYYRYDSDPSEIAESKLDWGILSGLRYKFN
jgi:hypothetical protein